MLGTARARELAADACLLLLIFVVITSFHLPLLRLPFFWDEAGYYAPAAYDVAQKRSLIPVSTLSNAHPPLPAIVIGVLWKAIYPAPSIARLAMLLVTAFALLQVYKLGALLANRTVAWLAVACTATYPVWFAQSSMIHADLPAAAFSLWGLRLFLERRMAAAALAFALAVLSKETAILTPVVLLAWEVAKRRRSRAKGEAVEASARHWVLLLPALVLAGWYAYHWSKTGYIFGNPGYVAYNVASTLDIKRFFMALALRIWHVLGHMNLFVLTALMAAAMLLRPLPGRERIAVPHQLTLLVVILAHVVAFSLVGGAALARYLLPVLPLVVLIAVSTVWRRMRWWPAAIAVVLAAFAAGLVIDPPYRFAPEDNLSYRHFVKMHQYAARIIEWDYPDARVITAWPGTDELTRDWLGYVVHHVHPVPVRNFTREELTRARARAAQAAFVFSTKYQPARPLLPRLNFWEQANRKYFDYYEELPPKEIAALLGGRIVHEEHRGGLWVAIIDLREVSPPQTP